MTQTHIGGLIPLRPTEMFDATIVPSGSFCAAAEKTFSPGLRSASVAGAKVTTATFGGTANVFSPSLYFKTRVLPLLLATWVAIVALVIVLLGIRSQGRWPSPGRAHCFRKDVNFHCLLCVIGLGHRCNADEGVGLDVAHGCFDDGTYRCIVSELHFQIFAVTRFYV